MSTDVKPTVSVCMITYNHEPFIAQAIEGVLMQETDFPIELVIGEDCSTDATRSICEDYVERFPGRINLLERSANLGIVPNFVDSLTKCRGTYVALCEGDDYWTDKTKLQRQFDFLETNMEYSGICSTVDVLSSEDNRVERETICNPLGDEDDIDFDSLLHDLIIYTPSLMFRNYKLNTSLYQTDYVFADLITHLLLLDRGPIRFERLEGVIYRIHDGGITSNAPFSRFYEQAVKFLEELDKFTEGRHSDSIQRRKAYLSILLDITKRENSVLAKTAGALRYLMHERTRVTTTEFKNILGLAYPGIMKRLRRLRRSAVHQINFFA